MKEVWKEIPNYEGRYMISNKGNIYSNVSKRNLKPHKREKGYMSIVISLHGKTCGHMVHRLVANAFIKNPKNKPYVNHLNYIKDDNRVENLEWVTLMENTTHSLKNYRRGTNHQDCRLSENEVRAIRLIAETGLYTNAKIADFFKITTGYVCHIKNRRKWKHLD